MFQGNWDRVIVAAPASPKNAALINRDIADIARERAHDPLDVFLDLGLEEDLETGFIGRFFDAVDDGVAPLLKHPAGVVALSDAGAHLMYLCDAGFGLYLLGHWVRERGVFDLAEGVRRLTSHQAGLYGIPDRGRIEVGAFADLLLFDPATVGVSAARRVNDLPGGGPRTIRDPVAFTGSPRQQGQDLRRHGVLQACEGSGAGARPVLTDRPCHGAQRGGVRRLSYRALWDFFGGKAIAFRAVIESSAGPFSLRLRQQPSD